MPMLTKVPPEAIHLLNIGPAEQEELEISEIDTLI